MLFLRSNNTCSPISASRERVAWSLHRNNARCCFRVQTTPVVLFLRLDIARCFFGGSNFWFCGAVESRGRPSVRYLLFHVELVRLLLLCWRLQPVLCQYWVSGSHCFEVVCWVPPSPLRHTSCACLRSVVFVCARRFCFPKHRKAVVKWYPEPMAHGPEACEPSHACGSR